VLTATHAADVKHPSELQGPCAADVRMAREDSIESCDLVVEKRGERVVKRP